MTRAFVGSGGIRAGWRVAIFLLIFAGLIALLSFIARAVSHNKPSQPSVLEPRAMLHNEVVAFFVVLFAAWVISRIEHRRIADYGLPLRRAFRSQFWQGTVIGFAAISALLGSLRIAGVFRFGTIGLRGFELYGYAVLWGLVVLFVGFFEEFFFRGYPLFTLTMGITFWPSAVLLSALFGLIHMALRVRLGWARPRQEAWACFSASCCVGAAIFGCPSDFTPPGTGARLIFTACRTAASRPRVICSIRSLPDRDG